MSNIGRVLEIEPIQLGETALLRKSVAKTVKDEKFLARVARASNELSDLRVLVAKLMPYVDHTVDCMVSSAVLGDGGVVVHEARPCTCGLTEVLPLVQAVLAIRELQDLRIKSAPITRVKGSRTLPDRLMEGMIG